MALWTPANLSSGSAAFAAGYRADQTSEVTGYATSAVTQWSDWSGNGRHLTAFDKGADVGYSATGLQVVNKPAVSFGSGLYLTNTATGFASSLVLNVFAVFSAASGGSYQRIVSLADASHNDYDSGGYIPIIGDVSGSQIAPWINGGAAGPYQNFTANTPLLVDTTFNSAATSLRLGFNGTQIGTASVTYPSRAFVYLALARRADQLGSTSTGQFSEVVIISGDITATIAVVGGSFSIQEIVQGYLAWKWGVQGNLPSGHSFKSAAPVVFVPGYAPPIFRRQLRMFTRRF